MNRKIKNIVSILLIIVLSGILAFTIYKAKNSVSTTSNNTNPVGMNENMGTPPDKPGGESDTQNDNNMGTPPEKPDGESNNNTPPEMNGNNNMATTNNQTSIKTIYYVLIGVESLVLSLTITYLIMSCFNKKDRKETFISNDKKIIYVLASLLLATGLIFGSSMIAKKATASGSNSDVPNQNMGGQSSQQATYTAKKEITSDQEITSGEYTSSTKDENVIISTNKSKVTLKNLTINKTGDSDGGDNTSFYGTNSAIVAKDGSTLTISNLKITTNATGANGVFSYGGSATTSNTSSDGTTVNISDSTITTTKDNSGGIMTTGGGVMNAKNLTINTSGISSAAIRSDRGGGTVTVDGGVYNTTGQGSPSIYSTANITVKNATLTSTASEGVVIEGKNSVTLENVTLTDTNNKLNGQSTTYKNIFLYQSMSGDADTGTASFSSKNSKIITNKGDSFYVTNTTAVINLENNTITNNDSTGNFLRVQKDSWGTSGSNGGTVTLNMTNQKASGKIVVDSISTLTINMKTNSYFEGTINSDNSAKSITLSLDKTSKIKLTGNTYVTNLEDADTSYSNIDFNGYKLYVNGKAIN